MCRGVIIREGLGSLNDHESVVMVPQSLVIDTDVARTGLSTVLSSQNIAKVPPPSPPSNLTHTSTPTLPSVVTLQAFEADSIPGG